MTFAKPLNSTKTNQCPRCGAPLPNDSFSICKYCFKFIDGKKRDEIKSEVTNISYDIPIIEFEKLIPDNCMSCGAVLKKESKGFCEYCKSNNNPADNRWILIQFKSLEEYNS